MWTIHQLFIHIYKQHRFIGQTQANTTYTFIQKHIHKHLYNVYTNMYIHHTLSFMHKMEQYIVNNKHVEQERIWLVTFLWQTCAHFSELRAMYTIHYANYSYIILYNMHSHVMQVPVWECRVCVSDGTGRTMKRWRMRLTSPSRRQVTWLRFMNTLSAKGELLNVILYGYSAVGPYHFIFISSVFGCYSYKAVC